MKRVSGILLVVVPDALHVQGARKAMCSAIGIHVGLLVRQLLQAHVGR